VINFLNLEKMKRIFLIVSLIFVALIINAQVSQNAVKYNGKPTVDTVVASQTTYSEVINVNSNYPTTYDLALYLDETSGAANVTITRQWSNNNLSTGWRNIDTVTWAGTADTLITYANQSMRGQYLRIKYVATATTQKSVFTEWFKNWYAVTPK
jgi:competence protein ComGC